MEYLIKGCVYGKPLHFLHMNELTEPDNDLLSDCTYPRLQLKRSKTKGFIFCRELLEYFKNTINKDEQT